METRILEEAGESLFLTTRRLHLVIPSIVAVDEPFTLRITSFGADGMPTDDFDREIIFNACPHLLGLPKSVSMKGMAFVTLDGLRIRKKGSFHISAAVEGSPKHVMSNPAWSFENPEYRLYWGDIHVHTTYSNCSPWACKDPEFCYAFARDASYLDFAASADHLRGIVAEEGRWERLQNLSKIYNKTGQFVTFLAFESSHRTGLGGDNNAYFIDDNAPYFWLEGIDMRGANPEVHLRQLWEFLDKSGFDYMTVPHHTGRAAKCRDFTDPFYDEARERVFEIYSGWGSSEKRFSRYPLHAGNSERPTYFQDALRQGCRYGVIASSDDHTTMAGSQANSQNPLSYKRLSWYVQHGLTAVYADQLSRESIWNGLTQRRCYGTTFERTLIDVSIDGIQMGEEAAVTENNALFNRRTITSRITTTDNGGLSVTLIRNGDEIMTKQLPADQENITFEDECPLDTIALKDSQFHPEPFVVYYLRVESQFKQSQWSSPIWLDLQ